jgi:hypothetical protein
MNIDEIILQHSTRGMDIVQNHCKKEHCKEAVEYFITLKKGVVFLYTGFYVNGYAETDGPIGTYFLALSLNKIGYKTIIITDDYCKNYFKQLKTIYIPLKGYTQEIYQELLDRYNPICHISIERCGKNTNGIYANASGLDISDFTAPIDELFSLANQTKPSFGIGDGGNEIGMANFKTIIEQHLHLIPCDIRCDYPIVSSVSNWGAYGFIAYLQIFTQSKLLPSFEMVDGYLEYIVSLGCVDGIKQTQTKSVDGKNWDIEKEILNQMESLSTF